MNYFCESDPNSKPIIEAGLADGTVIPWRVDGAGRAWFKQLPAIHGVPRPAIPHDLVADLADEDDDDEGECVLFDADGEQIDAGTTPTMHGIDPACNVSFEIPE